VTAVTVFGTTGCPFCAKAGSFLAERNIPFQVVDLQPGSTAWLEMRQKTGSETLPQIVIGTEPIGGYGDLVALETTGELYEKLGLARQGPEAHLYDVVIVGGGPAGLSAAIYTSRKVLKTLLITQDIGGQVSWTSDVDNYLGFSQGHAVELISRFEEHVKRFNIEKLVGMEVTALDLSGKTKKVITGDGKTYLTKTVILATGKHPKQLGVPGEAELIGMGVSYCSTCDAPLFADLDCAVAGGGNSALESVLDLLKVARKVYLISLTPLTADQVLQEKAGRSPKLEIFTEHEIVRILGDKTVEGIEVKSLTTGKVLNLQVAGVIVEIGLLPNSQLVIDTVQTNPEGEIVVDSRCRTGVAGLFACGDVTDMPYKQIIVAAGEGAKAALSAYDYIINER